MREMSSFLYKRTFLSITVNNLYYPYVTKAEAAVCDIPPYLRHGPLMTPARPDVRGERTLMAHWSTKRVINSFREFSTHVA